MQTNITSVQIPETNTVSVWLVPATDVLNRQTAFAISGAAEVTVLDITGLVVKTLQVVVRDGDILVDMKELVAGVYSVKLVSDGGVCGVKVVKK